METSNITMLTFNGLGIFTCYSASVAAVKDGVRGLYSPRKRHCFCKFVVNYVLCGKDNDFRKKDNAHT